MALFDDFRAGVRLDDVRLRRPRQIFLCGGPISTDPLNPGSARQYFLEFLRRAHPALWKSVILAESIVGDHVEHGFSDLLELERLLAEVVAVVLLFVESPGSLSELGAFTASDTILERLTAVIEDCHRDHTNSFVYLGPISRLTKHDEKRLMYAPWLKEGSDREIDPKRAEKMAESVAKGVSEVLHNNGHTKVLLPTNSRLELGHGERMCLVTGLLDVYQVLSKSEIDEGLRLFAHLDSDLQISRYLYVLRKLGIVGVLEHRGQKWYYANSSLIDWRYLDNSLHRDTMSWMRHFRDAYLGAMESGQPLGKHHGALQKVNDVKAKVANE